MQAHISNVKHEKHVLTVIRMHLTSHNAPNNPKPDTQATRTPMAIANREMLLIICSKVVAFSWSMLKAGRTSLLWFNFKTIPATISVIPSNCKAQSINQSINHSEIRELFKEKLFDIIFHINKNWKDIG